MFTDTLAGVYTEPEKKQIAKPRLPAGSPASRSSLTAKKEKVLSKKQLFPYQQEGIDKMTAIHGGILLADEQGLGKTPQVAALARQQGLFPLLIVCPASLKNNWERELRDWAKVESLILSGKDPQPLPDDLPPAVICNYDILYEQQTVLMNVPWKCIAFDEAHNLSNRSAKRTKAAKRLSRLTTKVIGISGTPLMNRPADFWPILNIIRPELYPSWQAFAWKFCDPKKTRWGWEYKGATNLQELHQAIQPFTIRRKKEDVLKLPDKHRIVVQMPLSDPKELQSAEDDFVAWLTKNSRSGSVEKAKKAEAVTKLGALLRLTAKLKCRSIVEWCQKFLEENPTQKLIVFAIHKNMIDVLERRIYPEGTVVIDGSVPSKKRQAIVDSFQHDPKTRLMVANIKAAGVGLTLTAASNIAFAELWWAPSAVDQADARTHRIGQNSECTSWFLIAPNTLEEKIAEALQKKQQVADAVIDGKVHKSMPILDMLLDQKEGLFANHGRPNKATTKKHNR